MAAGPAFEATISAIDRLSPIMKTLRENVQAVGLAARASEGELEGMERQVTRFGAAGEQLRIVSGHVRALRGHFDTLSEAIGGVHSRLSNLLPALGGLASITSVAGVFHLVEKVSERRNESIKTARNLGITTSQLGAIDYAAAVSDVDSGTVETGVARLERNLSMAARGKDKNLAGLFDHLHLRLRDSHGQLRSVTDVLPDIADAIKNTKSPAMRIDMAQTFFGKGGTDLVGFLGQGGDALRKSLQDIEGKGFTTKTDDDFRAFNKSMVTLNSAVKGVTNTIAATLAPVLKPVVDMFSNWLIVNREWIGQNLKQALIDIGTALRGVDWTGWGQNLRDAFTDVRWAIDHLGGLKTILEGLIAIRVFEWGLGVAGQFAKIAGAIGKAGDALSGFRRAAAADAVPAVPPGAPVPAGAGSATAALEVVGGSVALGVGGYLAEQQRAAAYTELIKKLYPEGSEREKALATAEAIAGGVQIPESDAPDDGGLGGRLYQWLTSTAAKQPATVRPNPGVLPQFPRILVPLPEVRLPLQNPWLTDRPQSLSDMFGADPRSPLPQLYPAGGITVPPAPPVRGQVDVTISIPNLPSGGSVSSIARGDVRVRTETGRNYPDGDVHLGDLGFNF